MMSSCTKEDDFSSSNIEGNVESSFIHLVVNSDGTTSTGAVCTDCGNLNANEWKKFKTISEDAKP